MTSKGLSPVPTGYRVPAAHRSNKEVSQADRERSGCATFTILSAPPGFGRGEELHREASKRQEEGHRIIWLKPKQIGNDARSVLLFLGSELADPASSVDEERVHDSFHLRRCALARIEASDAPITLAIDDGDVLFEGDALDELIDLSLECGGRLQVIIAHWISRPSRIARLSIKGRARQIGGWNLCLEPQRIDAALALPEGSAPGREIYERCWGWPVAVESVQRAAAAGPTIGDGIEDAIETAFGPHSEMALFIASEILPVVPEEILRFLTLTSIAETVDLVLARKLMVDIDAVGYMAFLTNFSGLVRIEGTSFRLNPLLRSHLLLLFERLPRSNRLNAWRTLADHYAAAGELLLAVRAAFTAEDADKAAGIAEELGVIRTWLRWGFAHMSSILGLFSADAIDRYPRLQLGRVIDLLRQGRVRLAKALLQDARERTRDFTISPGESSLEGLKQDALVAELFEGLYTDIISPAAVEILERECRGKRLLDFGWTESGLFSFKVIAHQQWGAFRKVERMIPLMLDTSLRYTFDGNEKFDGNEFFAKLYDGWAKHALEGPVRGGEAYVEATGLLLGGGTKQDRGLICLSEIMLAETLYERGRLEEAESKIVDHIAHLERSLAWYDFLAAAYMTSARLAFARSGMAGALAVLDRAEVLANERGLPALLRLLPLLRLEFLLRRRELDEARRLIEEHLLEDTASMPDVETTLGWRALELLWVGLAEYSLLEGRLKQACAYIASLQSWLAKTERRQTQIIALLLRASLWQRRGARSNAVATLKAALEEGEALEIVQPFHDRMALINPVLEAIATEPAAKPGRLLDSLIWTHVQVPDSAALAQLNSREMEVLQAVADSKSNKAAARVLGISDNTIKFHLKRIAAKLNMVGCGRDVVIRSLRRGGQL